MGGEAAIGVGAFVGGLVREFYEVAIKPTLDGLVSMARADTYRNIKHDDMNWAFQSLFNPSPHPIVGVCIPSLADVAWAVLHWTCAFGAAIGKEQVEELFLELIQEGFSNAVQTSIGGALQTALNVKRGGAPAPSDFVFEYARNIEFYDYEILAFACASAGLNLPLTLSELTRGVNEVAYERFGPALDYINNMLAEISDNSIEHIRLRREIARRCLIDAIEIPRAVAERQNTILHSVAERHLARVNELEDQLLGLKKLAEAGMEDWSAVELEALKIRAELEASKEAFYEYVDAVSEAEVDADTCEFIALAALDELIAASDQLAQIYDNAIQTALDALQNWMSSASDKIVETQNRVGAYRETQIDYAVSVLTEVV